MAAAAAGPAVSGGRGRREGVGGLPTSAGQTSNWTYQAAGGPTGDGVPLYFVESTDTSWTPCTRNNGASPDSIGVSLNYTYTMITPLSGIAGFFGGGALFSTGTLPMSDRTVMALNP